MKRRDALRQLATGTDAGRKRRCWAGVRRLRRRNAPAVPPAPRGLPAIRIKDVQTILTAPNRIRLVVVKVMTERAGPLRLGCATFTSGRSSVQTAIDKYLKPFLDRPARRRDRGHLAVVLRQLVLAQRPGAVQRDERRRHGALGHQGEAGRHAASTSCSAARCRPAPTATPTPAAATSRRSRTGPRGHASRATATSACSSACRDGDLRRRSDARRQRRPSRSDRADRHRGDLGAAAVLPHAAEAVRAPAARRSATRSSCCTTSTSASHSTEAIQLCKDLEPYRLFFLEDPFPPEDNDYFRHLRQQTSTPIAMGELFNTQHEYVPLISDR